MENVLFSVAANGVANITLNRPKAINSLTHDMLAAMRQKLLAWKNDDRVKLVVLQGAGSKGLCAGGDIKALYAAKENQEALDEALHFFEVEYQTDLLIQQYPKPIIASLDGIVMGGGIGLSYGSDYRIVTEKTKWAMPEMNIGFFPDVGAAYFLNKAPGYVGRYLALNAKVITAADVLYIQGADYYMSQEHLSELLAKISSLHWDGEDVRARLAELIEEYAEQPANKSGNLASLQEEIDQHFCHDTVEAIISSLEADTSDFTKKTKETMLSKSPVSLKVTLKQMIAGEGKSFAQCLETDRIIAGNFMQHADFYEGIRSVLIDKDQNPQYAYKQLGDVSEAMVDSFFTEDRKSF